MSTSQRLEKLVDVQLLQDPSLVSRLHVLNAAISMHHTKHFLACCVDCGEAVLDSKGRRKILHGLVAEVTALIEEPLQNRNESGAVLVQDVGRGFCIRFLARLQTEVSLEVVLENQNVLMTGAGFSKRRTKKVFCFTCQI